LKAAEDGLYSLLQKVCCILRKVGYTHCCGICVSVNVADEGFYLLLRKVVMCIATEGGFNSWLRKVGYTHCCGICAAEYVIYSMLRKMDCVHCCGRWITLIIEEGGGYSLLRNMCFSQYYGRGVLLTAAEDGSWVIVIIEKGGWYSLLWKVSNMQCSGRWIIHFFYNIVILIVAEYRIYSLLRKNGYTHFCG
jgi:hypothetical protein